MALNYTVILSSRQQFGDDPNFFGAPGIFVGQEKEYSFDCPDIGASETAFLLFQSLDVTVADNVFEINGQGVFGGLPQGGSRTVGAATFAAWTGNIMLVEPRRNLKATGNVLHVKATIFDRDKLDNLY